MNLGPLRLTSCAKKGKELVQLDQRLLSYILSTYIFFPYDSFDHQDDDDDAALDHGLRVFARSATVELLQELQQHMDGQWIFLFMLSEL